MHDIYHDDPNTNVLTFSSISLSVRPTKKPVTPISNSTPHFQQGNKTANIPVKASCFSFPSSATQTTSKNQHSFSHLQNTAIPIRKRSLRNKSYHTVSSIHSWLGTESLAHEDGGVGIMFLHGRVCALEEGSNRCRPSGFEL